MELFCENSKQLLATNYFYKTLYHRRLTGLWIRLCLLNRKFQKCWPFAAVSLRKIKSSIKHFFSKCDEIRRILRIWSHLLKKSLIENFIFCAVDLLPLCLTLTDNFKWTTFRIFWYFNTFFNFFFNSVFNNLPRFLPMKCCGDCQKIWFVLVSKATAFPKLFFFSDFSMRFFETFSNTLSQNSFRNMLNRSSFHTDRPRYNLCTTWSSVHSEICLLDTPRWDTRSKWSRNKGIVKSFLLVLIFTLQVSDVFCKVLHLTVMWLGIQRKGF